MPTWVTIDCSWCNAESLTPCTTRTGGRVLEHAHAYRMNRAAVIDNVNARKAQEGKR